MNAGLPGSAPRGPAFFRNNQNVGHRDRHDSGRFNSAPANKDFHPPTGPAGASRGNRHQRDRSKDRHNGTTIPLKDGEKDSSTTGGLPSSSFNFIPNGNFGNGSVRGGSPFTGYTGKRTLTDFRIIGFGLGKLPTEKENVVPDQPAEELETEDVLDWMWGNIPKRRRRSSSTASTVKSISGEPRAERSHGMDEPAETQPADDTGKLNFYSATIFDS